MFFVFFLSRAKSTHVPLSGAKVITRKLDSGIHGHFSHMKHSPFFLQRSQNCSPGSGYQDSKEKRGKSPNGWGFGVKNRSGHMTSSLGLSSELDPTAVTQ